MVGRFAYIEAPPPGQPERRAGDAPAAPGALRLADQLTDPTLMNALEQRVRAALEGTAHASLLDHGGGLLWFSTDPTPAAAAAVRGALESFAGHVHLIRASDALREQVDVFPPLNPGLARLTRGVKASFDPERRLNPGRMYDYV